MGVDEGCGWVGVNSDRELGCMRRRAQERLTTFYVDNLLLPNLNHRPQPYPQAGSSATRD